MSRISRRGANKSASSLSLSSKLKTIARTWKRRIREHKKLTLVIILVLLAVILFFVFRKPEPVDRINNDFYTHAEKFADSLVIDGIDVSEHQGEIDWDKVKRAGVDYVFVRVGYRDTDDGKLVYDADYEYNLKQAKKHGLIVGAYVYSQAITVKEGIAEADFIIDAVKKYDIDMPLVIDYEFYDGGRLENAVSDGSLSATQMNRIVLAFCKIVGEAGYDCAIYGNYNMLHNYLDGDYLADYSKIWVAQYNDFCELPGKYQFWQCSSIQQVAGIEGNVDKDFWYLSRSGEYSFRSDDDEVKSVTKCMARYSKDAYKFRGWAVEPNVKITYDGKKLRKNKDYTINYVHNTAAGTGYAIVKGVGKYADIMAFPFSIIED